MADVHPLAGRVAVITGASRGIGRATALELSRAGAHVALLARSTAARPSKLPGTIESVAAEVVALGGRALAVAADITSEDMVHQAWRLVERDIGPAEILVNNAAYMHPGSFLETPLKLWDRTMSVNLRGTFICTQEFVRRAPERGWGRVTNISSSAPDMLHPGLISYAVSKAALETLTRFLAADLSERGIAVNALRVDRPVATEGARFLDPDQDVSAWEKPEQTARTVRWLVEQPAEFTGQVLSLTEARGRFGAR